MNPNLERAMREKDFDTILKSEYSERFDKIRKEMMVMSCYKYGPLKDNYGNYKCMNAIGNIRKRLERYEETGNTEFLADIANFAMIEFMCPSIPGAHYEKNRFRSLRDCRVWDPGTEKQMIYKRGFGSSFYFWKNSRSYKYQTNFL